jgi:formate hydrogenlyase subunit 3/multisubunit Na+/H+ antiporter MnhD subunit
VTLFFISLTILAGSGLLALAVGSARLATGIAAAGAALGGCLGVVASVGVLAGGPAERAAQWRAAWSMPVGSFVVGVDPLSALFLILIFAAGAIASIYGVSYWRDQENRRRLGFYSCCLNGLIAAMALAVLARNGVLFLVAWEAMSLASFFLVTFDHDRESVRRAGITYLIASHVAAGCIAAMFLYLGLGQESLDFDQLKIASGASAWIPLLLAFSGFGIKAGIVPFHIWLPEAHPAAPSHVSALMSGVMIKMGIYGWLRVSMILRPPHAFAWLLLVAGLGSAVFGIAQALRQTDLKRLLAYSSIENVGIIATAIGLAFVQNDDAGSPVATLALAGALLHVVHHCAMKGLLFMSAGAVVHGTGTGAMDRLGGVIRQMPFTAICYLVGAAAICGLPPFPGFLGEFLIFTASLGGGSGANPATGLAVLTCLSLAGGLALAVFSKSFGTVFLGHARGAPAAHGDAAGGMRTAMACTAAFCVLWPFVGILLVRSLLAPVIAQVAGLPLETVGAHLDAAVPAMGRVVLGFGVFIILLFGIAWLRRRLLRRRSARSTHTWNCGYRGTIPRAQYTGASFAQPLTDLLHLGGGIDRRLREPKGLFPEESHIQMEPYDPVHRAVIARILGGIGWIAERVRVVQQGKVNLYVLYIEITLFIILVWKLGLFEFRISPWTR